MIEDPRRILREIFREVLRMADIPTTNQIQLYLHCAACLRERPANVSPREWAKLEVGWTPIGIQIWCKRHELNVMHIDFQGAKHPASDWTAE